MLAAMRGKLMGAIHSQARLMAFTLVGSLAGVTGLAATIAQFA